ncbi:hypothetical protein MKW92_038868, partial [Papaver armeniacum]
RVEEIIADGEAIQCNQQLMSDLRYLIGHVKDRYHERLELRMNRQAEEEA